MYKKYYVRVKQGHANKNDSGRRWTQKQKNTPLRPERENEIKYNYKSYVERRHGTDKERRNKNKKNLENETAKLHRRKIKIGE